MKLFRFKKRAFTLIEMMIALGLLALLVTFVFGFYYQMNQMHHELDEVRQENFRFLYVQQRLVDVLSNASLSGKRKDLLLIGKKKVVFFSSQDDNDLLSKNSLVLMYNNGVDYYPHFSSDVLGRLYLDKKGCFCLATWPSPKRWVDEKKPLETAPLKKEVLLEHVETLSFEFYSPRVLEEQKVVNPEKVQTEKIEPEIGWQPDWKIAYEELPAMVKVVIEQKPLGKKTEKLVFVIPLENTTKTIFYYK